MPSGSQRSDMARHLWLIGMMGSGKSSIGAPLAERLDMGFVDTDAALEIQTGMAISAIFSEHGEPWFREEESRMLTRLAEGDEPHVVATGGGVVLGAANRAAMRNSGLVIWLFADLATLIGRVGLAEGRPLIGRANPVASMDQLLVERYDMYADAADAQVSTIDREIADVMAEVEQLWQSK